MYTSNKRWARQSGKIGNIPINDGVESDWDDENAVEEERLAIQEEMYIRMGNRRIPSDDDDGWIDA